MIFGFVFNFTLWKNCPTGILFHIFFWFGQCMVFAAFMMSTLVKTQERANLLSYSLIIFFLLINVLFSNSDFCLKLFYAELS